MQPARSAALHCENWAKDAVTVQHLNSNWQSKVLPNLSAAAAAAVSVLTVEVSKEKASEKFMPLVNLHAPHPADCSTLCKKRKGNGI